MSLSLSTFSLPPSSFSKSSLCTSSMLFKSYCFDFLLVDEIALQIRSTCLDAQGLLESFSFGLQRDEAMKWVLSVVEVPLSD